MSAGWVFLMADEVSEKKTVTTRELEALLLNLPQEVLANLYLRALQALIEARESRWLQGNDDYYDRELLVKEGLLTEEEVKAEGLSVGARYSPSDKGRERLAKWQKNDYDATKFSDAPLYIKEMITVELESLGMTREQILSYIARNRESLIN
jgi:hypothetical protein